MATLVRIIDKISNIFGIIAGIFMILGTVLIVTEVIVRSVFDSTIYITAEYSAYFMVAVTLFGLAIAMKDKAHIRVTLLHGTVKTGKPRFILDLYTFIIGFIVSLFITYSLNAFFWNSFVTGSKSMQLTNTYLAIPQSALVIGSFLLSLQLFAEILRMIIKWKNDELDETTEESKMLGR